MKHLYRERTFTAKDKEVSILMSNCTTKLSNSIDLMITVAAYLSDLLHIHIELSRRPHCCTTYGASTDHIYGYHIQAIKDMVCDIGLPFL